MLNWLKRALGQGEPLPKAYGRMPPSSHGQHLHLTRDGDAAMEAGDFTRAAKCYKEALELSPHEASVACRLAFALKELNQAAEAEAYARQALALDATNADAHYLLALLAVSRGHVEPAIASFRSALQAAPDFIPAYAELSRLLFEQGRATESLQCLEKGIAAAPGDAQLHAMLGDTLHALGNALQAQGHHDEAMSRYRAALDIQPDRLAAWFDLGNLSVMQGKPDDAITCYRKILAFNPADVQANFHLGIVHHELKQYNAAIVHYRAALEAEPGNVDIRINLGNSQKEIGDHAAAISSYEQALAQNPDSVAAHVNLGILFTGQNRYADATASFEKALAIDPESAAAHLNLGILYVDQGRFTEAMQSLDKAVALEPESATARTTRGLLALLLGQFESGWKDYEYRNLQAGMAKHGDLAGAAWLNDADIAGKSLLLYADQGMGDTIQFARYIGTTGQPGSVASLGAKVYLEVHAPLKRLFVQLRGVNEVISCGDIRPPCDYHCALSSLPLAFQTRLDTIPREIPYLAAQAEQSLACRVELDALAPAGAPRIGVVWAGNPQFKGDSKRSVALEYFKLLFEQERYQFFILQKDIRDSDAQHLPIAKNITNLGPRLNDFADTAAMISNLDLVITVDTAVAHLAGAMGKPVWILLPFVPDFRWLLNRRDSPWYPSARLFRQTEAGNWPSVIDAIVRALGTEFDGAPGIGVS